jgi:tRNA (mo5U34)-methyltransferase
MNFDNSQIIAKIKSVEHWYHRIEVRPGLVTPGINDSQNTLKLLNIPTNCSGLKVLDIGTRDGFFAFEFEKRGAKVVAIDYYASEETGFETASELLNSKVEYFQDNIYNLNAVNYGTFDVVLLLGLIYHLPDPIRALNIARSLCDGDLYLETQVIDNALLMPDGKFSPLNSISKKLDQLAIMQFYQGNSLNNDFSNYWAPNMKCMESMLTEADFKVVEKKLHGQRGIFKCRSAKNEDRKYYMEIATGVRNPEA